MISYGLAGDGSSEGVSGGGEGSVSGLLEGEAGQEEGEGNSLMVTVTRLVVTSVTTTSLQVGISGCQSGSPSAGTLLGSVGAELWSPAAAGGRVAGSWRLAPRWLRFFLPPSVDPGCSTAPSSSSSTKEEEGEEGRNGDADAAFASEDGAGADGLVLGAFWVSV